MSDGLEELDKSMEPAEEVGSIDANSDPEVLEEKTEAASEPVSIAEESVSVIGETEPEVIEPIELNEFVLKVGNKWFKSWSPYQLVSKKSEAKVLDADWARQYKSDIKMMKRVVAEIIKL